MSFFVLDRNSGAEVASVHTDPFDFAMNRGGHPAVQRVLDYVANDYEVVGGAGEPERDGGNGPEVYVEPPTEAQLAKVSTLLRGRYALVEQDRQGEAASPFQNVPVIGSGEQTLTRSDIESLVRWKMGELIRKQLGESVATDPEELATGEADFNPSLHPRGPNGQFVERPWDFDLGLEDINDTPTPKLVQFLHETEGEPNMDAVLSSDDIRIDGIPDDVDSVAELAGREGNDLAPFEGDDTAPDLINRIERTTDLSEIDDEGFRDQALGDIDELVSLYPPDVQRRFADNLEEITTGGPKWKPRSDNAFALQLNGAASSTAHESGHGIGGAYGIAGGIYPDTDNHEDWEFNWDGKDVIEEKHALRDHEGDLFEDNEVPGLDDFVDRIESEAAGLDRDEFEEFDGDETAAEWLRKSAEAGDMIRAEEPLPDDERFGNFNPSEQSYTIVDAGERLEDERAPRVLTVEDYSGDQYEIEATVEEVESHNERTFLPDIIGRRTETPENWGLDRNDPDDVLGTKDLDGDDAMREYFEAVNEAWYRQAVTKRDGSQKALEAMTIGQGDYSVEQAGETLARMNESLTGESNHSPAAAHALVNYHPRLLEAVRNTVDIPEEFRRQLNEELDDAGADFRFDASDTGEQTDDLGGELVDTLTVDAPQLTRGDVSRGDDVIVKHSTGNVYEGRVKGFPSNDEEEFIEVEKDEGGSVLVDDDGQNGAVYPPDADVPPDPIMDNRELPDRGTPVRISVPRGEFVGRFGNTQGGKFVSIDGGTDDGEIIELGELLNGEIRAYPDAERVADIPDLEPLPSSEGGLNDIPDTDDPDALAAAIRSQPEYAKTNDSITWENDISDEKLADAKELISDILSRANGPELAREYARRTQIGNNDERATNGATKTPYGRRMNVTALETTEHFDRNDKAMAHEMGHALVQNAIGNGGASTQFSWDGNYWPEELGETVHEPEEFKEFLMAAENSDDEAMGWGDWNEEVRRPFESDDWEDASDMDWRELEPGDVINFEKTPQPGTEETQWEVYAYDDFGTEDEVHLRSRNGKYTSLEIGTEESRHDAGEALYLGGANPQRVSRGFSDPDAAEKRDDTRFMDPGTTATVDDIRDELPDDADWREKTEQFVSAANRAFYEMWLKKSEQGTEQPIIDGYSATTAGEVPSQTHELFQFREHPDRVRQVAKNYPHLTAAYLEMFEPGDDAKEALADVDGVTV